MYKNNDKLNYLELNFQHELYKDLKHDVQIEYMDHNNNEKTERFSSVSFVPLMLMHGAVIYMYRRFPTCL